MLGFVLIVEPSTEIMYPGFNDQGIETIDMDLDETETQAEVIIVCQVLYPSVVTMGLYRRGV